MSKGREISDYLDDIVTAIADAEEFTRGMSYEMFAADKKTVNAVIRCLEILGEAAKHIPTSFRIYRYVHGRCKLAQNEEVGIARQYENFIYSSL